MSTEIAVIILNNTYITSNRPWEPQPARDNESVTAAANVTVFNRIHKSCRQVNSYDECLNGILLRNMFSSR